MYVWQQGKSTHMMMYDWKFWGSAALFLPTVDGLSCGFLDSCRVFSFCQIPPGADMVWEKARQAALMQSTFPRRRCCCKCSFVSYLTLYCQPIVSCPPLHLYYPLFLLHHHPPPPPPPPPTSSPPPPPLPHMVTGACIYSFPNKYCICGSSLKRQDIFTAAAWVQHHVPVMFCPPYLSGECIMTQSSQTDKSTHVNVAPPSAWGNRKLWQELRRKLQTATCRWTCADRSPQRGPFPSN